MTFSKHAFQDLPDRSLDYGDLAARVSEIMDRMQEIDQLEEPDCGASKEQMLETLEVDAILDELRQIGASGDTPYRTFVHMLLDLGYYARIKERLRSYALPGELPPGTFERLIDVMTGFHRGAGERLSQDGEGTAARPVGIWTGGSCGPIPGPGGWAAILRMPDGTEREISGTERQSDSTRAELTAAVRALEALPGRSVAVLHTDSEYVFRGASEWMFCRRSEQGRKKPRMPVGNRDLWQRLYELTSQHNVEWRWMQTRDHAIAQMNRRADRLAAAARDELGTE